MFRLRAVSLWLALLLLFAPAWAWAMPPESLLLQGMEQYRLADFVKSQETFEQVLAAGEVSAAQLAQAHAYLGLIHLALDEPGLAQASFARVKAADPGYQPDPKVFPPKALELFNRASAAEAAAPSPPPPPDGFVVEVKGGEVTIDLGASKGVTPGDRFRVETLRRLKHPVTGQELVKREERGIIVVTIAQAEVSTAKPVKGAGVIKAGDMIFRLPRTAAPVAEKAGTPEPAAAEKPKPAAKQAAKEKDRDKAAAEPDKGLLTVAVLPPILRLTELSVPLGPDDFPPSELGRVLSRVKKVKAWAVSDKKLKQVEAKTGFRPEDYLLVGGATLRSVARAIREGDKEVLDFPGLSRKQTTRLTRTLDWLGAKALLVWSVDTSTNDSLVVWVNLYRRGQNEPVVRDSISLFQDMARQNHAEAIVDLIKGALKAD